MADVDRRAVLGLAAGAFAALVGPRRVFAAEGGGEALYAACAKLADDSYAVVVMDEAGSVQSTRPLPGRGHDVAYDPVGRRCVAFARRPGTFAVVFDLEGRTPPVVLASAENRHFYGHGVFTADGGLLYATENDWQTGVGVIGLYDARDGFRRIGEFQSGGIGPHELVWLPDGRTLAVANGGLDTHPEFGRVNLNTVDMAPSLALIDADSRRLLAAEELDPALKRLSIRHLVVDRTGAVWFGGQYEGDATETPPLVGRLRPGRGPDLFDLPEAIRPRARNYIGSVAASADGDTVAFSAPKGNMLFAFEAGSARFLGSAAFRDGCGIAPAASDPAAVLATAGTGRIGLIDRGDGLDFRPIGADRLSFDNHVNRLA